MTVDGSKDRMTFGAFAGIVVAVMLCAMYFKQRSLGGAAIEGIVVGVMSYLINLLIVGFAKRSSNKVVKE